MDKRVVITGMGIWSCLGTDVDTVKQSLFKGVSGIGVDEARIKYGYRSGLTGIVEKPAIGRKDIDRHIRAGMSKEAEYAYMAAKQAFAMAGIDHDYLVKNETGCIFGNDSSARPVIETFGHRLYADKTRNAGHNPVWRSSGNQLLQHGFF